MLYCLPSEIAYHAPGLTDSPSLDIAAKQYGYINQACRVADAACRRVLAIRNYSERVKLDQSYTGLLLQTPWLAWNQTEADVFAFGDPTAAFDRAALANFHVNPQSGALRSLVARAGGGREQGFTGNEYFESPQAAARQSYYASSPYVIQPNHQPFFMTLSYRAGFFCETSCETSGAVLSGVIKVASVQDLAPWREFYFEDDPLLAPDVDTRVITSVDAATRLVGFTPALGYQLAAGKKLRMIDAQVRSAVCDIIADLIVYPANTRIYDKNLGKRDLEKRWTRMNDQTLPVAAADKLDRYARK